jgi:hypothetical protein
MAGMQLNETAMLLQWIIGNSPQHDREVLSCVLGAVNDARDTLEQLQPALDGGPAAAVGSSPCPSQ